MGCDGLQGCRKIYEAGGQISGTRPRVVGGVGHAWVCRERKALRTWSASVPQLAVEVSNRLM